MNGRTVGGIECVHEGEERSTESSVITSDITPTE